MDSTLKFLSLSGGILIGSLLAACASGTDDSDPNGSGGTGSGSGGSSNAGSSTVGGAAGGSTAETQIYGFDTDLNGFVFNDSAATLPYVNLVPSTGIAYTLPGDPPTLLWASKDSDGAAAAPGSIKITATFSDWNQSVSVEVKGPVDKMLAPIDLTNKKLRARVFLEKGLSSKVEAPGGVVFYVKSGATYAWGQARWKNLDMPGMWTTVLFDTNLKDPGSSVDFDPSSPVQLGFQISSGGGGEPPVEFGDTPLETVVYIDQVTWSN